MNIKVVAYFTTFHIFNNQNFSIDCHTLRQKQKEVKILSEATENLLPIWGTLLWILRPFMLLVYAMQFINECDSMSEEIMKDKGAVFKCIT